LSSTVSIPCLLLFCALALAGTNALADESQTDTRPSIAPDIREDDTKLKFQDGDTVIVPIPMSNPTLGTGLVVGGAYFYPQTEEQARKQPASLTGAGVMYTSNDSKALIIGQQNYWNEDRWRFTGAIGAADIRLSLLAPDESGEGTSVDYTVSGPLLFAQLSRRLKGDWYGGLQFRVIGATQTIETDTEGESSDLDIGDVVVAGLGPVLEYDSRDLPMNSYSGRHLKVQAILNYQSLDADNNYQSYSAFYRSYHSVTDSVVLAWELHGCQRVGTVPLWSACTVALRGFSATDYLGMASASTQLEARWKFSKRWGLVGFAGVGSIGDSFSGIQDNNSIPSYGFGIRFMVLQSKRINMRVDFARSADSDAVYLSVGEAF
jgi:hypothetical protein